MVSRVTLSRWVRVAALLAAMALALAGIGESSAAASVRLAAAAPIRWGRAEPVPGLAALNKSDNASVNAVSCWAEGDCAAGGFYTDKHHQSQAFVAVERKGRWGNAIEVPGTAALNAGGSAQVGSVSCARTTVCAVVGTYTDKKGAKQWFTAAWRDDRWGKATRVPVPGLAEAQISTVWCAPGVCAAGGEFTGPAGKGLVWVMTQTGGRWHAAIEVPGIAALTAAGTSDSLFAVACSSPGTCAAGGQYAFNSDPPPGIYTGTWGTSAFVLTETNGRWGKAEQVPGMAGLNQGWWASTTLISCPSAGNCTAAGTYVPAPYEPDNCDPNDGCTDGFTVTEHKGGWETAKTSPLYWDLNALTCTGAGDCALGGDNMKESVLDLQGGIVNETNGTWGKLVTPDGAFSVYALSCSSAGYCAAGGPSSTGSAYVASERRGAWGKAFVPVGIPHESIGGNGPEAQVSAVSCPPGVDVCAAGGFYDGPDGGQHAFLVSQSR
jgi:hypothetical protein